MCARLLPPARLCFAVPGVVPGRWMREASFRGDHVQLENEMMVRAVWAGKGRAQGDVVGAAERLLFAAAADRIPRDRAHAPGLVACCSVRSRATLRTQWGTPACARTERTWRRVQAKAISPQNVVSGMKIDEGSFGSIESASRPPCPKPAPSRLAPHTACGRPRCQARGSMNPCPTVKRAKY